MSSPDPSTRLSLASDIFTKVISISEVSKRIATSVDESLSKQQKEFFLRQQLVAIQRELQSLHGNSPSPDSDTKSGSELDDDAQQDADDLAEVRQKIEAMAMGSEERKMGVREWRRLKRIPQASVESGVIRNYVSSSSFLVRVCISDAFASHSSLNGSLRCLGIQQKSRLTQ